MTSNAFVDQVQKSNGHLLFHERACAILFYSFPLHAPVHLHPSIYLSIPPTPHESSHHETRHLLLLFTLTIIIIIIINKLQPTLSDHIARCLKKSQHACGTTNNMSILLPQPPDSKFSSPQQASSRLLIRPPDHPPKLLEPHLLPHDRPLGLVLLVDRHLHHLHLLPLPPRSDRTAAAAADPPAAHPAHKGLEVVPSAVQPGLGDGPLDGAAALADGDGDADAHRVLEAGDVGDEVGVEVVRVEGVPEVAVGAGLEEGVEVGELLDGFGEGGVWDGRLGGLRGGGGGG